MMHLCIIHVLHTYWTPLNDPFPAFYVRLRPCGVLASTLFKDCTSADDLRVPQLGNEEIELQKSQLLKIWYLLQDRGVHPP